MHWLTFILTIAVDSRNPKEITSSKALSLKTFKSLSRTMSKFHFHVSMECKCITVGVHLENFFTLLCTYLKGTERFCVRFTSWRPKHNWSCPDFFHLFLIISPCCQSIMSGWPIHCSHHACGNSIGTGIESAEFFSHVDVPPSDLNCLGVANSYIYCLRNERCRE